MMEASINIEGMSCQHCVMSVKKAIGTLDGISEANVTIGNATVRFDETKVKRVDVEAAIEAAGYRVKR